MEILRFFCCLVFLFVLPISASGQGTADPEKPLRIAIDKAYSPYSLLGPTGEPAGLAVEIWRAWSAATGRPIEFVPRTWEGTIKALRLDDADVHFGLFKNASRAEWMDFAEPIHQINSALFFRAGDDATLALGELSGERIGVWSGTFQQRYLVENFPNVIVIPIVDDDALILKLLQGEIRAFLNEVPSVQADLASFGVRGVLARSKDNVLTNDMRPSVRRGEFELLDEINAGFQKISRKHLNELERLWLPNPTDHFYTGADGEIVFTPEEVAWLAENPVIKLAVTTFIQPVDVMDQAGNYTGLNADLIDALNQRLGTNIVPEFYTSWSGVVDAAMKGEVDGAFSLSRTEEREKHLLFTPPYAFDPIVAVMSQSRDDIDQWADLAGKNVSVVKGASIIEEIYDMVGDGVLVEVESETNGLKAIEQGTVDIHMSWLIPYGNAQRMKPVDGVKIALTRNSEGGTLRIGIHNGRPELLNVIRKGMNATTPDQLAGIRNKWLYPDRESPTDLNREERQWLREHPVTRLAVLKDYPPFDMTTEGGAHIGIHTDLLQLINKRLGTNIVPVPFETWSEAYDKAKAGEFDGIMSLSWTRERENLFLFSTPYHYTPADLVVRSNEPRLSTWSDLSGKTVWTRSGSSLIAKIKKDHPTAEIREAKSETEALTQLAAGTGDAYVAWISIDRPRLKQMGLKRVAAVDTRQGEQLIGVHPSRPLVAQIIQRGLNAITPKEMAALRGKWIRDDSSVVDLTTQEIVWLASHPVVTVANELDWPPFDFAEKGEPMGYAIDMIRLAAEKTGLKLDFKNGYTWAEILDLFHKREIDILPAIYETAERDAFMAFTKTYATNPSVLVVREGRDDIKDLDDLADKRVATVTAFATAKVMAERYPTVQQVPVENVLAGIKSVSFGKTDAFIGSLGVISHILKTNVISDIKIVGEVFLKTPEETQLHMGFHKDDAILRNIVQKGLDAVSTEELRVIRQSWMPISGGSEKSKKVTFSAEQEQWLKDHPVLRLGDDFVWPPFVYLDDKGQFSGIAAGYSEALAACMGVQFEPVTGLTWTAVLEKVKSGEIDILPAIARSEERETYLNFSKPYISFPSVVATQKTGLFVDSLSDLSGYKVGVVDGYSIHNDVARDYPNLRLVPKTSLLQGLEALERGEIDAFVDNLGSITYELDRHDFENIKIAAPTEYRTDLSFGVRKDWPQLVAILDRALDTIGDKVSWSHIAGQFGGEVKVYSVA